MDPYREPLLVDPSSLSTHKPGRLARWRAALKSATPETAFRLLVVFLLGNVVATSAGTAVSLELQRREAGKLEKRFTSQLSSARQDLLEARSELVHARAEDRIQAMRAASQNRPAPPGGSSFSGSSGSPGLPATLDPAMRDVFERAQRQSIFQHLARSEQRAIPARQIAQRRQAEGYDVSVEDIALSEGVRARASLSWRELMTHPQTMLAGMDRVGAYTVRPQDSTVYRVLGLVPGDVLVSTNGQARDESDHAQLCSSQCGYLVPDLFERPGALTLEVLHEGARTVRAFTWEAGRLAPPAAFARAK